MNDERFCEFCGSPEPCAKRACLEALSALVEKTISDRIDAFLLKLAADLQVDAEKTGEKPSRQALVEKINAPKFLDLFEQILEECEAASAMPRSAFRQLFFKIVEQRVGELSVNDKRLNTAIERERRRRKAHQRFNRDPALSCPVCLDVPHMVSDPLVEFEHQNCKSPECSGHHYFYLSPPCHPSRGLYSEYCAKHGILSLVCNKCDRPVKAFRLQWAPDRQLAVIQ